MGIDAKIMLPGNVRVADVARIIGICAGKAPEKVHFQSGTGWSTVVHDVDVSSCGSGSLVGTAKILISGPFPKYIEDFRQGQHTIYVMYHFEPDMGGRLLMPPSTNFWVAVGKRLVDFFGGKIDYNDCDSLEVDYCRKAKPRHKNAPTSDGDWYVFQERLLAMKPLTLEELRGALVVKRIRGGD